MSSKFDNLSVQEKIELIRQLKETKQSESQSNLSLEISEAEKRMWLLHHIIPSPEAYNLCVKLSISGEMNNTTLKKSLQKLLTKHAILQSNFYLKHNSIVREIATAKEPQLEHVTHLKKNIEIKDYIKEHLTRPFNLEKDSLFKTLLISKNTQEHSLIFIFHHSIIDGWGIGCFLAELESFYNNTPTSLPPSSYTQYINYEKQKIKSPPDELKNWLKSLSPCINPVKLIKKDIPKNSFASKTLEFELTPSQFNDIKKCCKTLHCTPFMFIFAVYVLSIYAYTGKKEFCVGVPLANRLSKELEPLIGLCVNTLPVKLSIDSFPTIESIIKSIKNEVLTIFKHQDYPINKLIEQLPLPRISSENPLFECFFAYQNEHIPTIQLGNTKTIIEKTPIYFSPFEFNLECYETEEKLTCYLHYQTDIYSQNFITKWHHTFTTILNSMIVHPKSEVIELPLKIQKKPLNLPPINPVTPLSKLTSQQLTCVLNHPNLKNLNKFEISPQVFSSILLASYISQLYNQTHLKLIKRSKKNHTTFNLNFTEENSLIWWAKEFQKKDSTYLSQQTEENGDIIIHEASTSTPTITNKNQLHVVFHEHSITLHILSDKSFMATFLDWQSSIKTFIKTFNKNTPRIPLPDYETQKIINEQFNDTDKDFKSSDFIQELIFNQAKKTPLNTAVVLNNESMTYEELYEKSMYIASYLIEKQFPSNSFIGVYTLRSFERIIAILGILAAGHCYTPLDTDHPKNRLQHIIKETNMPLIFTHKALVKKTSSPLPNTLQITVEEVLKTTTPKRTEVLTYNPETSAYIMYTSGTTGVPKGAIITHKALSNRILWMTETYAFNQNDKCLHKASCSFDVSIWELLAPLTVGAELTLLPPGIHKQPSIMGTYIKKKNVTISHFVPSIFDQYLQTETIKKTQSLRLIFCSGEKLLRHTVQKCYEELPQVICHNLYGPTEATIDVTAYTCMPSDIQMPIGKPIANTKIYIVNKKLQQVPIGYCGEIYISGRNISKGYLNNPELTEKVFQKNPFSPHERWYKTGDLGYWRSDGNIQFIGRIDSQVKINGVRVECQEIIEHINTFPEIKSSHVLFKNDQLYTFYTADQKIKPHSIITFLERLMPTYMIPKHYFYLKKLPVTLNQKIDESTLIQSIEMKKEEALPTTSTEKKLAKIWNNIVKTDIYSIHCSFFNYGGNSLQFFEVMIHINKEFKTHFSIKTLYQNQTISKLANVIDNPVSLEKKKIKLSQEIPNTLTQLILPNTSIVPTKKDIFITGATGFLGVHILNELLHHSSATLYCLVRCESEKKGLEKIIENATYYNLNITSFKHRICPIIGDLSSPNLGLQNNIDLIARNCESIYHIGCKMNHHAPYSELKKENVDATADIIKLATNTRLKHIHYISTTSVFSDTSNSYNEDHLSKDQLHYSTEGYAASKWVAEQCIQQAHKAGVPVTIYRCGLLSGSLKNGIAPSSQWLTQLLETCSKINTTFSELAVDVIPVCFASKAISTLSLKKTNHLIYHISNPHQLPVSSLCAPEIETVVPCDEWVNQCKHVYKNNIDLPIYSFIKELFKKTKPEIEEHIHNLNHHFTPLNVSKTLNELKKHNLVLPDLLAKKNRNTASLTMT